MPVPESAEVFDKVAAVDPLRHPVERRLAFFPVAATRFIPVRDWHCSATGQASHCGVRLYILLHRDPSAPDSIHTHSVAKMFQRVRFNIRRGRMSVRCAIDQNTREKKRWMLTSTAGTGRANAGAHDCPGRVASDAGQIHKPFFKSAAKYVPPRTVMHDGMLRAGGDELRGYCSPFPATCVSHGIRLCPGRVRTQCGNCARRPSTSPERG